MEKRRFRAAFLMLVLVVTLIGVIIPAYATVHNNVITHFEIATSQGETITRPIAKWEQFRILGFFELPDGQVHENDTTELTLPPELILGDHDSTIEIKDNDKLVAVATLYGQRKLVLRYTKYVEEHSAVKGDFYFYARVDHEKYPNKATIPIKIEVSGKVPPHPSIEFEGVGPIQLYPLNKSAWRGTGTQDEITYDIKVNEKNENFGDNAVLTDTLSEPDVLEYIKSTFSVKKGRWAIVNGKKELVGSQDVTSSYRPNWKTDAHGNITGFSLNLGSITPGVGFYVYYKVKIKYHPIDGELFTNKAVLKASKTSDKLHEVVFAYNIGGGGAKGYVCKIKILKTGENGKLLPGAKFDVIRERTGKVVGTLETKANGEAELGNLLRDTYKIVETKEPDGYKKLTQPIIVDVTDFDNTEKIALKTIPNELYTATGKWKPVVTKELAGRNLKNREFTFILNEDGKGKVQEVNNAANGTVPFTDINYTLADVGTHTYRITEKSDVPIPGVTFDNLEIVYVVKVSDNGDGTLKVQVVTDPADKIFNNTYKAEGKWKPEVTKKLEGRKLKENEFTFILSEEGKGEIERVQNAQDGTVPFSEIEYSLDDVGKHTYIVTELKEDLPNISYDKLEVKFVVEVKDTGSGKLKVTQSSASSDTEFNNKFRPPEPKYDRINVPLSVTKRLVNGKLTDGQFSFELYRGNTHIETKTNDANGVVSFTDRTFSRTGKFTYTIKEAAGSNSKISYDAAVYKVIMKISDVGGKLKAEVSLEKDGVPYDGRVEFVNKVNVPKTGDSFTLLPLYIAVLAIVSLAGVAIFWKNKNYEKR